MCVRRRRKDSKTRSRGQGCRGYNEGGSNSIGCHRRERATASEGIKLEDIPTFIRKELRKLEGMRAAGRAYRRWGIKKNSHAEKETPEEKGYDV